MCLWYVFVWRNWIVLSCLLGTGIYNLQLFICWHWYNKNHCNCSLPQSYPSPWKGENNHKRKCPLCICVYYFFLVTSEEILECLTSVISIWLRLFYFGQMCVAIGQVQLKQLNFPASLRGLCRYFCEWISLDLCSLLCAQNQLHCHPSYIIIKVQCKSALV